MKITKDAYAKVNLFLNVKGELSSSFHDLEMVNITVGLKDILTFELRNDGEININTSLKELNSKSNLSYKVANYMKKTYNIKEGVDIYIEKHIPVGGGLGGGSSDAAATIEGLNELWGIGLSFEEMFELAKGFGSDTPYCLYKGPAIVKGIGFDIEPINLDISKYELSLYNPKVNVSTGEVFKNLKTSNKYPLDKHINYLLSENYDDFIKGLKNDLQETVFELYPEVKKEYELLVRLYGEEGLFMTGSGSTIIKIRQKS